MDSYKDINIACNGQRSIMTVATQWLDAVWKSKLPTNSKVIAAFLRKHLHNEKAVCYPSISTIMTGTSMSKTSCHKFIAILEKERWISKKSGCKGRSNTYTILLDNVPSSPHERDSSRNELLGPLGECRGSAIRSLKNNRKTNRKTDEQKTTKPDAWTSYQDRSWADSIINS